MSHHTLLHPSLLGICAVTAGLACPGLGSPSAAALPLLQLDQALPQAPWAAPRVPGAGLCRDTCACLGDVWPCDSTGGMF